MGTGVQRKDQALSRVHVPSEECSLAAASVRYPSRWLGHSQPQPYHYRRHCIQQRSRIVLFVITLVNRIENDLNGSPDRLTWLSEQRRVPSSACRLRIFSFRGLDRDDGRGDARGHRPPQAHGRRWRLPVTGSSRDASFPCSALPTERVVASATRKASYAPVTDPPMRIAHRASPDTPRGGQGRRAGRLCGPQGSRVYNVLMSSSRVSRHPRRRLGQGADMRTRGRRVCALCLGQGTRHGARRHAYIPRAHTRPWSSPPCFFVHRCQQACTVAPEAHPDRIGHGRVYDAWVTLPCGEFIRALFGDSAHISGSNSRAVTGVVTGSVLWKYTDAARERYEDYTKHDVQVEVDKMGEEKQAQRWKSRTEAEDMDVDIEYDSEDDTKHRAISNASPSCTCLYRFAPLSWPRRDKANKSEDIPADGGVFIAMNQAVRGQIFSLKRLVYCSKAAPLSDA